MEGPSKAEVDFNDRKDGSCHVSYVVEEPGEYSVGIRFNEVHIPGSPYKVIDDYHMRPRIGSERRPVNAGRHVEQ